MKMFNAVKTRMIGDFWGIVWLKNYDDMLSCFHMIPQRHGRTDRHTDIYGQTDRFAISISRVSMLTPRNGSF